MYCCADCCIFCVIYFLLFERGRTSMPHVIPVGRCGSFPRISMLLISGWLRSLLYKQDKGNQNQSRSACCAIPVLPQPPRLSECVPLNEGYVWSSCTKVKCRLPIFAKPSGRPLDRITRRRLPGADPVTITQRSLSIIDVLHDDI